MIYNHYTLSFAGKHKALESEYRAFDFKHSLNRIRLGILVAALFYAVFGILDAFVVPDLKHQFWIIRYIGVCPFGAWVLWYSFRPGFEKHIQLCLFILCLLGGLGIEAMILLAHPPATYSYYAGIILIFITIFTFLRMRFTWAFACSWLIVLAYEISAIAFTDTPIQILINNNFFFISSNIFCTVAGYSIELNSRKLFFSNIVIEKTKSDLVQMNTKLDQRVSERTRELEEKTHSLKNEIREKEKSQAQQKILEGQLLQAQKMEAIGTLAGGIAHDFNNILTSLLGFTELALDEVEADSPIADDLKEIYAGGNRAKELVKQILAFARQSKEELNPIRVDEVAKEVLKLIRSSIPSTIQIQTCIESQSMVVANSTQLYQIIMNLCTNASHAMEMDGGVLNLALTDVMPEDLNEFDALGLENKPYVCLAVSDTGTGIDAKDLASIFEPYFTTKKLGRGTGMGLAMVHGIIKSYKGEIRVTSSPGEGSVFTVYLPASVKPGQEYGLYTSEDLPTGNERILFIDDEAAIAKMGLKALSGLGYDVTARTVSTEAFELFAKAPDLFDLVITDTTMPGMTGDILAKKMIRIRPDLPIILCTGFSKKIDPQTADSIGVKAFVQKPIIKTELARIVRTALDDTNPSFMAD